MADRSLGDAQVVAGRHPWPEPRQDLRGDPAFEAPTSSVRPGPPGVPALIVMAVQDLEPRARLEKSGGR
jgi:hypothetical protein